MLHEFYLFMIHLGVAALIAIGASLGAVTHAWFRSTTTHRSNERPASAVRSPRPAAAAILNLSDRRITAARPARRVAASLTPRA